MKIDSSGGAHTSTKEREARDVAGGSADKPPTKTRKPQSVSKPAREPRQIGGSPAAEPKRAVAPVSEPDPTPAPDPVRPPDPVVVQRPIAVVNVSAAAAVSTPPVKVVVPQQVAEVPKPSVPVRLVTGLLAGLGGSATGGDAPVVPDSPAAWALAGWTRSRMAQGKTVDDAAPAAQVLSSQALAAPVSQAGVVPVVLAPVSVGRDPVGVATFGSRVYVANQLEKTVR